MGLHEETESLPSRQAMGTRKSERQKKSSSRFNKEVGYLAEVPKSAKKKAVGVTGPKIQALNRF